MIDGWEGSRYDLSEAAVGQPSEEAHSVTIVVPEDAYRLLLDHAVGDPARELVLYSARPLTKGVELSASDGTWGKLIGFVASEANLTASRDQKRRLGVIHGQLESALRAGRT
jgi:hypothetical protein